MIENTDFPQWHESDGTGDEIFAFSSPEEQEWPPLTDFEWSMLRRSCRGTFLPAENKREFEAEAALLRRGLIEKVVLEDGNIGYRATEEGQSTYSGGR